MSILNPPPAAPIAFRNHMHDLRYRNRRIRRNPRPHWKLNERRSPLARFLAAIMLTGCTYGIDACDYTSLEHLEFQTCGTDVPWSDENVPEFSAQGNPAMYHLCQEAERITRINQQAVVYCVSETTPNSFLLAWGDGSRPGAFLVNSPQDLAEVIHSYWESL